MCAIDFPDTATRDKAADEAYEMGMMILPCGRQSVRFRSPLDVTAAEIDEALGILEAAAIRVSAR
jgi:L-lysine 6-transaminase